MRFAIGEKIGMTQMQDKGKFVGVSVFKFLPAYISQIKSKNKDGYNALQLGIVASSKPKLKKPQQYQLKKVKIKEKISKFKEIRIKYPNGKNSEYKIGGQVNIKDFKKEEKVDAKGVSIGKGFQGVIKRHGFKRGPETHGSNHHRAPGAIGQCAFPARVFKGKKMPGRMGAKNVTVKNLEIIKIIDKSNLILLKGSLPGKKGSTIVIKSIS